MARDLPVTGVERFFGEDEIIVSKTDLKGRITYANDVFLRIAGYTEEELLGQPHSIIRHPDMPRCVFKLLWDTIEADNEIFAFVINRAKNGDHYWVLAHVTPSHNEAGEIIGYHSNRRVPAREPIDSTIIPLYRELKQIEDSNPSAKDGMQAAVAHLGKVLEGLGKSYEELVWTL